MIDATITETIDLMLLNAYFHNTQSMFKTRKIKVCIKNQIYNSDNTCNILTTL